MTEVMAHKLYQVEELFRLTSVFRERKGNAFSGSSSFFDQMDEAKVGRTHLEIDSNISEFQKNPAFRGIEQAYLEDKHLSHIFR